MSCHCVDGICSGEVCWVRPTLSTKLTPLAEAEKSQGIRTNPLGAHWFTFRGPTAKNRLRRTRGWKNCRLVIELSKKSLSKSPKTAQKFRFAMELSKKGRQNIL